MVFVPILAMTVTLFTWRLVVEVFVDVGITMLVYPCNVSVTPCKFKFGD